MSHKRLTDLPILAPLFHRVESGWDPVSDEYAHRYAEYEYAHPDVVAHTLDTLEQRIGAVAGKRVLDLGGGPGHFAIAFAQRGAHVTWHDPSHHYLEIAREHAAKAGVECEWSLGFLEQARQLADRPFDLVFQRICWYYCASDASMADLVCDLVKPGGSAWLDIPTADWWRTQGGPHSWREKLLSEVYRVTDVKLAYFMPERGKVSRLISSHPGIQHIEVDWSVPGKELVWFTRQANGTPAP